MHEEYNGDIINIIVKVPANTVGLTLTAKTIGKGDEIHEYRSEMALSDVFEARNDFLDNVECGDDYDAVYTLTEKGRQMVEAMMDDGK